jgi:hypothetical protein
VVGFAWTPRILERVFGRDQTVFRGGFRIAYDFQVYNLGSNVAGSAPFVNLVNFPTNSVPGLPPGVLGAGRNIAAEAIVHVARPEPGTPWTISESFDTKKVTQLPIGNNFDSLSLFVPGVATVGDSGFSNNNGAEFTANGERARSNNFQIDGQNNNDNTVGGSSYLFGNQDAIAEVQVITNYSAEYGRNMGSVVNYILKSGTNQFHGTAYEFWDGDTPRFPPTSRLPIRNNGTSECSARSVPGLLPKCATSEITPCTITKPPMAIRR